MKVSIITTTYNAEKSLERTVLSVLSQKDIEVEYIITDGGSTDRTAEIAKKFPSVSFYSEPDNGIYDGMNKGIGRATGDLIGILNAGDYYASGAIKKMVSLAENNPEVSVFHGKLIWVDAKGQELLKTGTEIGSKVNLYTMPVRHPTVFIRSKIYQKHGMFDANYKIAADHKLIHKLRLAGERFFFADQVITYMESGGASAVHRAKKRDEVLKTIYELGGTSKDIFMTWYEYFLKTVRDKVLAQKIINLSFLKPIYQKIRK